MATRPRTTQQWGLRYEIAEDSATAPQQGATAADPSRTDDSAEAIECGECPGEHLAGCCVSCSVRSPAWGLSLKYGDHGAEKLSAELEQRAVMEAETLVGPDGLICSERLALLRRTFDPTFVPRVLARVPFASLAELSTSEWDGDAMNTSTLLEDFREIRQWQEAAVDKRSVFPNRLVSMFDQSGRCHAAGPESSSPVQAACLELVPQSFLEAHPHVKAQATGRASDRDRWADVGEFRSLLRSFSHGLLEGLPLGPERLVLSGSCMPWCVRRLTPELRRLCSAERMAAAFEGQLCAQLARQVGQSLAARVLWMAFGSGEPPAQGSQRASGHRSRGRSPTTARSPAGDVVAGDELDRLGACGLRRKIREQLLTQEWEDADLDLFVVGSENEAADTVRQTVSTLQRNIDAATGGRGSVVLRTCNTLTIVGGHPLPNVQVVCKIVRSMQELLVHADVDCSAMAYDGAQVWAAPRALRAIASGYNFIPKQVLITEGMRNSKSRVRYAKYYGRGFGLVVFEHCRHVPRCDHTVEPGSLEKVSRLRQPKGPANLRGSPEMKGKALADWMLRHAPLLKRKRGRSGGAEQASTSGDGVSAEAADDVRSHRFVPGDRMGAQPDAGRGAGVGQRSGPMSRYGFMDIIIPCGPGVCAETLRAYVRHLGVSELLHEVTSPEVTLAPKTSSDRQQLQDRARGKCYMCKVAVASREPWPLCESCQAFCRRKLDEKADCGGMVAVVTGGRMKIGLECALRLLRNGATVVVTSRFPRCTRERYIQEPDFGEFRDRLAVLGADFRRLASVQVLIDTVLERFQRIDVLIHNAAQTIHRPPAYFESLIQKEKQLAPLEDGRDQHLEPTAVCDGTLVGKALALLPVDGSLGLATLAEDLEAEATKGELFPPGKVDAHGEQLDLRKSTSWTQRIEDTEMPELAEVLAVNLVVPYLLTARWLPLLRRAPASFVVFVTSQEGSFTLPGTAGSAKSGAHPHTNAAKAGLNMLARTLGPELRRDMVFTSAVDPGWVSWMKPGGSQATERAPLSEADGAARVLDPLFAGLRALGAGRCPPSGVMYKDFRAAAW